MNIYLDDKTKEELRVICKRKGLPMSNQILLLIKAFIEENK